MIIKTRKVDVVLNGEVVKSGFEVPDFWSDRAATIMATKYATDTENSALQIIDRVVGQIKKWGTEQGYFSSGADGVEFAASLHEILINQRAAFNSPVWFNCGVPENNNQMSACFIFPVEDNMEDILAHTTREGLVFRSGSGAGVNVSKLRAKGEKLSNKGEASGPISFMRTWDANAGSIKSGGKTRRSAKMVCMDVDHPDIMEFITCKKHEEDKARMLVAGGLSLDEAKSTVCFQNTNHSIRVNDKFMKAVESGDLWVTTNRGDKKDNHLLDARALLWKAAEMTWHCGDPGIQYDDQMNLDNPVPSMGRIRSTNPCSEFSAIDNSSCNLASLNLVKYVWVDSNSNWNSALFRKDIHTMITAMDILIEAADYPTPEVRAVTVATRPLGLGFSNLGALLMQWGIPYDSDRGRLTAKDITLQMTEYAYEKSIELAHRLGSYPAFAYDFDATVEVASRLTKHSVSENIANRGLRNSQLTLLAPTGTISFMMDCETSGIEPFLFEESMKKCVDGSYMKILSPAIAAAKEKYGDTVPGLYKTAYDKDGLSWRAHLDMMAACQQHLNGAISKTVAMRSEATIQDIYDCYVYGWEIGLKAIAIYRDGSKVDQPVSSTKEEEKKEEGPVVAPDEEPVWTAVRRKLLMTRYGPNHKFDVAGFEGYINTATYPEGNLGEIFVIASKAGSTMQGLLNVFATAVSIGLQYGVPLEKYVEKFTDTRFAPAGYTQNPDIRSCSSVVDYIFRWLALEFLGADEDNKEQNVEHGPKVLPIGQENTLDGDNCIYCGGITQRAGTCFVCTTCGSTSGCS